jgi:hypothetical protein
MATKGDKENVKSIIQSLEAGVVAHAYNPSYEEAETRRLMVRGQPEQYSKTLSQTKQNGVTDNMSDIT